MTQFDVEHEKWILLRDTGYEWELSFDPAKISGNADIGSALMCLLVNFDDPARRLIEHAILAFEAAIPRQRTDIDRHGFLAMQYEGLALAHWLRDGVHDAANLTLALEARERHFAIKDSHDKVGMSLAIAHYVAAGAWELAARRLVGAGIRPPTALSSIRSAGQLAHVICGRHLTGAWSAGDVRTAQERFLKYSMNTWLTHGWQIDAAHWLKIAHWSEGGSLTPKQVIMKAYDYLPGVVPPV